MSPRVLNRLTTTCAEPCNDVNQKTRICVRPCAAHSTCPLLQQQQSKVLAATNVLVAGGTVSVAPMAVVTPYPAAPVHALAPAANQRMRPLLPSGVQAPAQAAIALEQYLLLPLLSNAAAALPLA